MLIETESLSAAVVSVSTVGALNSSQYIGVALAPVSRCTNPQCGTTFTLPSITKSVSNRGIHTQYCAHCNAPLPILIFTTNCGVGHKELARQFKKTWRDAVMNVRQIIVDSYTQRLNDPSLNINFLLRQRAVVSSPAVPSAGSPFIGTINIESGSVMSFDALTNEMLLESLDSMNPGLFALPWCYSIATANVIGLRQDLYMLSSFKPELDGSLTLADTMSFPRSSQANSQ